MQEVIGHRGKHGARERGKKKDLTRNKYKKKHATLMV